MKMRAHRALVLLGLVLGLLAGAAGGAAAQDAPWRIVQSSDGTLYVLKEGARYQIVGDAIGDEELGAYAEGEAIGSALLLNAIAPVAEPAQPVAEAAPPPAAEPAQQPAPPPPAGAPKPEAGGPTTPPPAMADPAAGARRGVPGAPTATPTPSTDLQFVAVQGNTAGYPVVVSVRVPAGATSCALEYMTPAGARSAVAGLGSKTVSPSSTATWQFTLEPTPAAGSGRLTVTCGSASVTRPLQIGGPSR